MAISPKLISIYSTGPLKCQDCSKIYYLQNFNVCSLHTEKIFSRLKLSDEVRLRCKTSMMPFKRILPRMQESFSVDTCMVLPISAAARSGVSKRQQEKKLLGSHKGESYVGRYGFLARREIASTIFAAADSDQTSSSQNGGGGNIERIIPTPELDPAQVVQAQLQALRAKDFATVFAFASPANKQHTGPLSRFCQMLQGRAYKVMVGHVSAQVLSSITVSPTRFQQRVWIKGSEGKDATFSWSLSQQEEDPFKGCWMTDTVRRDD